MRTAAAVLSTIAALSTLVPDRNYRLHSYAAGSMRLIEKDHESIGIRYRKLPNLAVGYIKSRGHVAGNYDYKRTIRLNPKYVCMPTEMSRRAANKKRFHDDLLADSVIAHEMGHYFYNTEILPSLRKRNILDELISEGFASTLEERQRGYSTTDCSGFEKPVNVLMYGDPVGLSVIGTCIARPVFKEFGVAGIYEMALHQPTVFGLYFPAEYQKAILARLRSHVVYRVDPTVWGDGMDNGIFGKNWEAQSNPEDSEESEGVQD